MSRMAGAHARRPLAELHSLRESTGHLIGALEATTWGSGRPETIRAYQLGGTVRVAELPRDQCSRRSVTRIGPQVRVAALRREISRRQEGSEKPQMTLRTSGGPTLSSNSVKVVRRAPPRPMPERISTMVDFMGAAFTSNEAYGSVLGTPTPQRVSEP
jgi:hypothetical protein